MKLRKPSILLVSWVSSCPSLFLSASTATNCTTTIVSLESCALNAEFQHFILRFNKNVFTLRIPLKEGIGGWKEAQRQGEDRVTLRITRINSVQFHQQLSHYKHPVDDALDCAASLCPNNRYTSPPHLKMTWASSLTLSFVFVFTLPEGLLMLWDTYGGLRELQKAYLMT
jgi:hypothetical protein